MRSFFLALLCCGSAASAQTIYRWTDKHGEVHYSDDPAAAPKGAKVEATTGEELMVVPAAPVAPRAAVRPAASSPPVATRAKQQGPVEVRLTKIEVELSDEDRRYIEEALRTAAESPRLAAWGELQESISVEIAPVTRMGVEAFGLAVGMNRMLLRAPKETPAWGHPLPYADTAVHELAHLLEHHLAGMARPRWFAEGFASLVTGDTRQASLDDIAWWVIHEGGPRPLDRMFAVRGACMIHVAYAIAREALVYLVELVGEAGIKRMFDERHAGATFEAAFRDVSGLGLDEFQAQFAQWLKPHYYERAR